MAILLFNDIAMFKSNLASDGNERKPIPVNIAISQFNQRMLNNLSKQLNIQMSKLVRTAIKGLNQQLTLEHTDEIKQTFQSNVRNGIHNAKKHMHIQIGYRTKDAMMHAMERLNLNRQEVINLAIFMLLVTYQQVIKEETETE